MYNRKLGQDMTVPFTSKEDTTEIKYVQCV